MRFPIFRTNKAGTGISVQAIERKSLIDSILEDTTDRIVSGYRDIFLALDRPESRKAYNEIHACGQKVNSAKIWLKRLFGGAKWAWRDKKTPQKRLHGTEIG